MGLNGLVINEPEGLLLHGQLTQVVDPLAVTMGIDGQLVENGGH